MNIQETAIPGVLLLTPQKFADARGAFWETYNERLMQEAGLPTQWKQDNTSISMKNVVRGIHYQVTQAQGKLVRVTYGAVFDIAVDLRRSSRTFGQHISATLSEENGAMLWIPPGFGHGFAVLSEKAGFAYKVTEYYSPSSERTILWSDAKLAIAWPIAEQDAVVSAKDRQGSSFDNAEIFA
jgi:dTDP-4-dehydrorhamnose 3,5-epimerase